MKTFKLIFPVLLTLFLLNSTYAQSRFYGTVTEVIDGKTLVIQPQAKVDIKVELQYIETPEAEQKLYDVVRDHLKNMVLGKVVEFVPKNLNNDTRPIAQVLLGGVDVSQQMIRDGAAWYAVDETSGNNEIEQEIYKRNETLAKNEKRGVWSITNLKPAWEFRAEKAEQLRQIELKKQAEEKAKTENTKTSSKQEKKVTVEKNRPVLSDRYGFEIWSTEIPYNLKPVSAGAVITKGEFDLWYLQDVVRDEGWIGTPILVFNVFDKEDLREIYFGVGYDFKGTNLKKGGNEFTIGVGSNNSGKPFMKEGFYIELDNRKRIELIRKDYRVTTAEIGFAELIAYRITREELTKLSTSKEATLVTGKFKRKLNKHLIDSMKAIITATAK